MTNTVPFLSKWKNSCCTFHTQWNMSLKVCKMYGVFRVEKTLFWVNSVCFKMQLTGALQGHSCPSNWNNYTTVLVHVIKLRNTPSQIMLSVWLYSLLFWIWWLENEDTFRVRLLHLVWHTHICWHSGPLDFYCLVLA